MENAFEDALLKWANLPSDDVGLGGVFARELLATRAEGYKQALDDVQEMITEILENDTDAALVDIVAPLAQTKSAYEKGSEG